MSTSLTTPKLNEPLRLKVLAMMARGARYAEIQEMLEADHGISYTAGALSALRKAYAEVVQQMESLIIQENESTEAELRRKAMKQIGRKLDRANEDDAELTELDRAYRAGEMANLAEYRRKKAGLIKMNISELVTIAKEMQPGKTKGEAVSPTGAPAGDAGDPKLVDALMTAIKSGDTITLQQMIINPQS